MAGIAKYARKGSKQGTASKAQRMNRIELEDALRFLSRKAQEDKLLGLDTPTLSTVHSSRDYPGKWAASKPRVKCHGAAAMPPTPEAAQDLANGLIPPTVYWKPAGSDVWQVEPLATFTSNKHKQEAVQAAQPQGVETTREAVQPAIAHDWQA